MNNRLREVRTDIGMSITELARRANVSRQTIYNIERNGKEPTGSVLLSISAALRTDPRDIFFTNSVIHGLQEEKEVI